MGIDQAIDITTEQRKIVLTLLNRYLPRTTAWVYGSRAKWTSRPQSDLDMVVFATPEQSIQVGELREAFEESDLPFRVDLFVWDKVPDVFRGEIEAEYVVLSEGDRCLVGDWQVLRLSDVIHLIGGGTPKRSHTEYWGGLIPWLSVKDFNNNNRHVESAEESITELGIMKSSAKILKEGQLVISARGTVGALAQLSKPMAFNQSCYGIYEKSEYVTNDFLYYLIKHSIDDFKQVTHGAVFDTITRETFKHIWVNLPPLPEQRAIAHILGTLDDRIELNRRMNKTLEAMAQALFKSWFVDFDPVHARMKGRDTGLPDEISALFPDRMVDSELGEVPEGWRVGHIADIADSPRRGVGPANLCGETPYIGLEHMPRQSIALMDWGKAENVTSNKSIFEKGDILFGKLRPYFHKVGVAPVNGVCSTDIVVITPKADEWSAFVLARVSSSEFVTYTNQTSTGTRMPRTSWETMTNYRLCVPVTQVVRVFQNVVWPMLDHISDNIHESRALSTVRDTLLPKLVSGELRVTLPEDHLITHNYVNGT